MKSLPKSESIKKSFSQNREKIDSIYKKIHQQYQEETNLGQRNVGSTPLKNQKKTKKVNKLIKDIKHNAKDFKK